MKILTPVKRQSINLNGTEIDALMLPCGKIMFDVVWVYRAVSSHPYRKARLCTHFYLMTCIHERNLSLCSASMINFTEGQVQGEPDKVEMIKSEEVIKFWFMAYFLGSDKARGLIQSFVASNLVELAKVAFESNTRTKSTIKGLDAPEAAEQISWSQGFLNRKG